MPRRQNVITDRLLRRLFYKEDVPKEPENNINKYISNAFPITIK